MTRSSKRIDRLSVTYSSTYRLVPADENLNRRRARKVIYESAPAVNPEFESLAAPLVTGLDTLLPSRLEDKATLESDLSAAPEAEMGWGLEKVPGLPIGVS